MPAPGIAVALTTNASWFSVSTGTGGGGGGTDPPPAPTGRSLLSTNIPDVTYYRHPVHFLDLVKQAPDWGYGGGESIPLRSDGFPTAVTAGSGVYAGFQATLPASGQFVAAFDGTGTLAVDFGGSVVSNTSNRYVLNLTGDSDGRVGILITSSSSGNPVRNLRVVPIAYESTYASVVYHQRFMELIAPFQVLRFMDFHKINNVGEPYNDSTDWSTRIPLNYALQGTRKGPAIEHAIDICNANQSDLWLCIPSLATTNWIDGCAALVAGRLNAGRKLYFEFSNEVWNDAFQNGNDIHARGISAGLGAGLGGDTYDARFGFQAMMGRYARAAFIAAGMSASRVKHVLATQTGFDDRINILRDWQFNNGIYTDGQRAYQHADYIATAPYIGVERGEASETNTDSVTTIISKLQSTDTPPVLADVVRNKAQATARGLGFCMYEGGQHLYNSDFGNTSIQNKLDAVNRHTNMYGCMANYLSGIGAQYNGPMCIYTLCGPYGQYGRWGWMENMNQVIGATPRQCPKMDAALDWIAAHPL